MIIETQNKTIRKSGEPVSNDISYLQSYYSSNNRFPLFTQVLIETRTDCNKRCTFCPQYHFNRKIESMKWKTFKKIIDSLGEIGFAGRIAFLVTNEPLLDMRLLKMINYARRKSSRFFLDITTNGTLLSIEKVEELLSAGLDNININDYRSDRNIEMDKISENLVSITEIFNHNPKISYSPRSTHEVWPNYAGVIPQPYNRAEFGFCNFPFRKLVFSVKGDVVLCCNDYFYETKFGSIHSDSILSIWNSEKLNLIRIDLLNQIRNGLCSKCNDTQTYTVF